jgi:hypothetical protein
VIAAKEKRADLQKSPARVLSLVDDLASRLGR